MKYFQELQKRKCSYTRQNHKTTKGITWYVNEKPVDYDEMYQEV
jgi:hypothetical protein